MMKLILFPRSFAILVFKILLINVTEKIVSCCNIIVGNEKHLHLAS